MEDLRFPVNVDVQGNLIVRGNLPVYPRASLRQDDFQPFPLPLTDWRVWDAFATLLGTPASDDLGITAGTWATGAPYVTAGDLKAAGATTRRARFLVQIPLNYVAAETVQIRLAAGMLTTVADTSCTVDVEAYKLDRDATIGGSDLVATSATTINSLTFGNKDFDLTATTLSPGDWLDVRVSIACTDAATVTAVTPAIAAADLLVDIKG